MTSAFSGLSGGWPFVVQSFETPRIRSGLRVDLDDRERLAADPVVALDVDQELGRGSASSSWPRLTSGISTRW